MIWLGAAGVAFLAWFSYATATLACGRPGRHRHGYVRVGYGGAGWSLYRCACGAEEIDA